MKPTLLFDLDGTLSDSHVGIVRCFQYALEKAGEPVPMAEDLRFVLGPPLSDSFRQLGIAESRIDELIGLYRERYVPIGMKENTLYQGIAEMLETLSREHRLYVATSKAVTYARQIVAVFGLSAHFAAVHGSELDGTRANKADLIRWIVREEGLNVGTCVMIGDRRHDIAGARACAMNSVGVLWGYGSREELETAGADTLVDSPEALTRLFSGG